MGESMLRRIVQLLLVAAVLAAAAPAAWAGAFTLPDGQFLGALGVRYFNSYHYFDNEGTVTRGESNLLYRDITPFLGIDVGVTDNFELNAFLPFRYQYVSDDFDETTTYALGDFSAEGTFKFVGGNRGAMAVTLLAKLPMFYDPEEDLPPGDGQIDLESRLLAAVRASFFTFSINGGYRYRFEDPSDVWRYGGSIGFNYSIVSGAVGLDGYASAKNQEDDAEWRDFTTGPDYALGLATLDLGVMFTENLGMMFLAQYTAYGRNAAYGGAYTLSLLYSF